MTPQEISAYKIKWMPGVSVRLHSDLTDQAKTWCKRQLDKQCWSCTIWTAPYEHTFHFEDALVAQNFKMEFNKVTNQ